MIIKKKKLNKTLGNVPEQPQYDENSAEISDDIFSSVEQEILPQEEQETDLPDIIQAERVTENNIPQQIQPEPQKEITEEDLFSLDNIDFKQRQERRKGDRRRGFRRVDDRNLISRAREEADAIRESAVKEGYQAGMEQASEELQQIRETFAAFMNAKQEVYEQIAPDILEISVDIAQKIIKKEVSEDPQVLVNNIVDVLKSLSKDENKIALRVNPVQVDVVKQQVPEILTIAGLDARVSVLADEEVSEGGCLVTTSNGVVDATVETQLSVICEALKGV
ncbi:MAG: flagellar assembly protein FliH [Brachyspira sp.]|mgnify:FL=1|nr:flagellar assembly protein FliH [Brachyspira sp.]